jgi:hypothetical protein
MPVFEAVIALVCCIVSLIVPAQEQIQQYVRKQAVQINSIQSDATLTRRSSAGIYAIEKNYLLTLSE